ncbi:Uma2 family endonuclease [Chloracidobacterium sp. D]|uniref:Uma2 family endonuclease n=1 Tax=Chloracidobacterium sp. D TaxID=2821536 RepID=UPI001B8D0129|nr:Uma2 family endonuclease [Chloracidobacterium sp. D]QUV81002.1 Uma2 family endonuclease [Chloracidobacterium sp. D]
MSRAPSAPPVERRMSFEEYLRFDDGTDTRYELVRGVLVPMPTATAAHELLISFLAAMMMRFIAAHDLPYVVRVNAGVQTEEDTSRLPDIAVYDRHDWERLLKQGGPAVLRLGEPMRLVVEVTSENWKDDYYDKRAEYEQRRIPEYWIVDGRRKQVVALYLAEDATTYQEQVLKPGDVLASRVLAGLTLPVETILAPPMPEDILREELQRLSQAAREAALAQERIEAERQRAEAEHQRAELERQRAEAEQQRAEAERQRAEAEHQRAELERQRAEAEQQRAEAERQRAEAAEARLQRLAARLRELGLDANGT